MPRYNHKGGKLMTMSDQKIKEVLTGSVANALTNVATLILVPLMGFVFTQIWTNGQDIAAIKVELMSQQRLDSTIGALDTLQRASSVDIAAIKAQLAEMEARFGASRSERNEAIQVLQAQINDLRIKEKLYTAGQGVDTPAPGH